MAQKLLDRKITGTNVFTTLQRCRHFTLSMKYIGLELGVCFWYWPDLLFLSVRKLYIRNQL